MRLGGRVVAYVISRFRQESTYNLRVYEEKAMNQWTFLLRKSIIMFIGLFVFGTGSYIGIQANIGLGAWEAFQIGLSDMTGISYGNISLN